ncbi:hypothetical protein LCGC14_1018180 [marine sediment metagenome]|uniref:Uncharacterized protein n=1 Tax=marine sediment metagenome TaxID=412755 RepID=A0A0F9QGJ0_9ZZZZ
MQMSKNGKYRLFEIQELWQVGLLIQRGEMFEWKGKLLHWTFISNLPLTVILNSLKYGSLRHAVKEKESKDADQATT